MITNWKILGAGVLGVVAAGIWIPRLFGGSGPKVDPSAEPPAEYWESGATEPWSGATGSWSEDTGLRTGEFSSEFPEEDSGVQVSPSDPLAASGSEEAVGGVRFGAPVAGALGERAGTALLTSRASSGDVDTDRLLSVARALRGESFPAPTRPREPEPMVDPGFSAEPPPLARGRTYQQIQDLIDSLHLSATLIGEQTSMAMIDGELLSVGDPVGTSGVEIVDVAPRRVTCSFGDELFELDIPAFRTREASSSSSFEAPPGDPGNDPEL